MLVGSQTSHPLESPFPTIPFFPYGILPCSGQASRTHTIFPAREQNFTLAKDNECSNNRVSYQLARIKVNNLPVINAVTSRGGERHPEL